MATNNSRDHDQNDKKVRNTKDIGTGHRLGSEQPGQREKDEK